MKNVFVAFSLLLYIPFTGTAARQQQTPPAMEETGKTKTHYYIDGNNNKYMIAEEKQGATITYMPITNKLSSSGTYNGGEPYKISITKEEFTQLTYLVAEAVKDKSQLLDTRNMGCGTIMLHGQKQTYYLKMGSPGKMAIEDELEALRAAHLGKDVTAGDTLVLKGTIEERFFESKKGVQTDIKEYYFVPGNANPETPGLAKEYFIKLYKSKISKDELVKHKGHTVTLKVIVQKGLWDTDDHTVQSRFGDYVQVLEVEP